MADTRPNITLPAGVYVDIYAALAAQSGFPAIPVGTKISVQLVSGYDVRLYIKTSTPTADDGYRVVSLGQIAYNDTGDARAFCHSYFGSVINVAIA